MKLNRLAQVTAVIATTLITAAPQVVDATTHHHAVKHHRATTHHASHTHRTHPTHAGTSNHLVQYYGNHRSDGHSRSAGLLRTPYSQAVYYTGGSGDYLAQTEGTSRWPENGTIKVYVGPGRSTFPGIVSKCFSEWSKATGGRIRWGLTSNRAEANYVIGWTSHQKECAQGTEAGLTTTDTYIDQDDGREYIDHAQTNILTRCDGRPLSDKELAETCLHEIGHGLGIEGHSSNPYDIMYYAVSSKQTGHLTPRDANTICHLYAY
ncbi:MAG TPA: matrixin family metalloprotease [Candidatus Obscuribacterales bacterium]